MSITCAKRRPARAALGPKRVAAAFLAAAAAVLAVNAAAAPAAPPAPAHFVTDGAGFLSPAAGVELDERLAQFERDSGHQVLLWIGQTTGGEPIEAWAVRAFAAWRVGQKGLDDGLVVFIMAADRKVRIEVGYGLEDRVTDARAARIIGDEMVPRLRAGDRDGAARAGVAGVLAAIGGAKSAAAREVAPGDGAVARPQIGWGTLILLGIAGILILGFLVTHPTLALMLLTTLASNRGRRGGWGGGGGFGGGGFGGGGGGGGFSGGGGRSGGGGATGGW